MPVVVYVAPSGMIKYILLSFMTLRTLFLSSFSVLTSPVLFSSVTLIPMILIPLLALPMNTVVAPPRMLISIMENNYQPDGSVIIPEVLRPYMGGLEKLTPKK